MIRLFRFFISGSLALSILLFVLMSDVYASPRYQVQIGSAKQLEGTRYFARKASSVLEMAAYIIKKGTYYVVLVGDYSSRDQAAKELQKIKKHYTGMVVSFEDVKILGAFENGQEMNAEAVESVAVPVIKAPTRKKKVELLEPKEISALDQTLEANIDNIIVEGCALSNQETLAEYMFSTTCQFGDLDPDGITIEEKYGDSIYIYIDTQKKRPAVHIKQMQDGKEYFQRADARLVLRSKTKNKKVLSTTVQALQDFIQYCSKQH